MNVTVQHHPPRALTVAQEPVDERFWQCLPKIID
jgi:hypothetical protein